MKFNENQETLFPVHTLSISVFYDSIRRCWTLDFRCYVSFCVLLPLAKHFMTLVNVMCYGFYQRNDIENERENGAVVAPESKNKTRPSTEQWEYLMNMRLLWMGWLLSLECRSISSVMCIYEIKWCSYREIRFCFTSKRMVATLHFTFLLIWWYAKNLMRSLKIKSNGGLYHAVAFPSFFERGDFEWSAFNAAVSIDDRDINIHTRYTHFQTHNNVIASYTCLMILQIHFLIF